VYHNKGYKIWVTLYKASSTGDVKNAQGSRDTTEEFASLREQLQSAHSQIARLKLDLDHSTQQLDHSTQQYVALHEFQAKQMRKRAKAAAGDAESASCSREPGQQKRKISELESTIIKLQNERHSPDLQVKPVIDSGGHSPDLQVKPVIDSGDDDKQVKEASQQASSPYQQGYPPEWRDGSAGTFSNDEDFA
jgi:predicted RNase H-like nuclease (RuvC/YqgF family)